MTEYTLKETEQWLKEDALEARKRFKESEKRLDRIEALIEKNALEARERAEEAKKRAEEAEKRAEEAEKRAEKRAEEADKEAKKRAEEARERAEEADKQFKEMKKEARERAEKVDKQIEETNKQIKETEKQIRETEKQVKATSRSIKKAENLFTNQWGKLMESLVSGDLIKLLNAKGIRVQINYGRVTGIWGDNLYEFDIVSANGEELVVTEVKTTLHVEDVVHFLDKMKDYKKIYSDAKDKTIYGAVAYLRVEQSANVYAERKGLFVIRATGSSASITNKSGFKPKNF